jgi:hypothetical protein
MANKRLWPEPYDPDAKYMAFKKLKVGTETLYEGDPIPDGSFNTRRMRQLYDARKIRKMTEKQIELTATVPVVPVVPVEHVIPETQSDRYRVEHRGGGWYNVIDNVSGLNVDQPMRKSDAEDKASELNDSDTV